MNICREYYVFNRLCIYVGYRGVIYWLLKKVEDGVRIN